MKRASEVPPVVDSLGVLPVTAETAPESEATSRSVAGQRTRGSVVRPRRCHRAAVAALAEPAAFCGVIQPPADLGHHGLGGPQIIEADVEGEARPGRNHVGRRIAGVDRRDLEV